MAEFQLQMRYETPASRSAMHVLALLFPIWGVATPVAIVLFLIVLLRLPANMPAWYGLTILAGMFLFAAGCLIAALLCDDNLIRVNKDGLVFPLRFYPALKFRAQRTWDELGAARLTWKRNTAFGRDEALDLIFRDGAQLHLSLPFLKRTELEQFFIAFEACAGNCERDADLPDFERAIRYKDGNALCSPTELWERSLAQRFSSATFVPLEPGKRLQDGRYQILRQLSFGGFAACYLARSQDGSFVVLKESAFPEGEEIRDKVKEAFKLESSLLSRLNHPNIARVHDYFVESGRHYLVMQYIEGTDLNRLVMQHGAQSPAATIALVLQLAGALQHMHEQAPPIVHRDITPKNLVLKPSGTLLLTEFGSAKEIVSNFTGTIVGKQSYTAPEQFKGKPCPRSDVYSLGAVAFFLLTGKSPEPLTPLDVSLLPQSSTVKPLVELLVRCTNEDALLRPEGAEISAELTKLQQPQAGLVPTS